MTTKQRDIHDKACRYIIDSIDGEAYNVELTTDTEKLQFLYDTFKNEYGYAIERYGQVRAFTEWLQGLPTAINLDFYNDEIIELAKLWGSLPENATEKQEQKIIANYYNFMANKAFILFRTHKII